MDLVTWLRAQLDEDERSRTAALASPRSAEDRNLLWFLLCDIHAKRAILDALGELFPHVSPGDPYYACETLHRTAGLCDCDAQDHQDRFVRLLASAYADRPGYQEAWRP